MLANEDPQNRGRIQIEILRRSPANASYTRTFSTVWVHHSRLTVVSGLPASPYPFEADLRPIGDTLAAQRRRARTLARR